MFRGCLLFFVTSCGVHEIKKPNTEQACDRAIECGIFYPAQRSSCVSCLEHVNPEAIQKIDENMLLDLDKSDCEDVLLVVRYTNMGRCVSDGWYD